MRNIRLTLQYDGTNYAGWQCQAPRIKTVQKTVENALRKILRQRIRLIGSGRTDAGVHAFAQTANFKTGSAIALRKLQKALNGNLPADISVTKAEESPAAFHARYDAKSKIYRYAILNSPHRLPLLKNKVYHCPYPLDIKLMKREAKSLIGRHDFKAFCASSGSVRDTSRTIKKLTVSSVPLPGGEGGYSLIIIDIEADGFLYNMARAIVGTLIDTARGRFAPGSLKRALDSQDRRLSGPTVPACGLCLLKVKY